MVKVYLLWMHDAVLNVYASEEPAQLEALRIRESNPYNRCAWIESRGGRRWYTDPRKQLSWIPNVSRLEIEERRVLG